MHTKILLTEFRGTSSEMLVKESTSYDTLKLRPMFKVHSLLTFIKVYGAWIIFYASLVYTSLEVKTMDKNRKKELLELYKNRHPEMGVISYRCKETGEAFLGISKETKSDFNSINMKLSSNMHPNKRLQELWNKYGKDGFELSVLKVLKYDDPHEDHTEKLEALREQCFAADPKARRIWR